MCSIPSMLKMPATGAERNRNYRKRIKANAEEYAKYNEQDKLWKRESRKKVLSPKKAALERQKCRDRVRLYRQKKKLVQRQAPAVSDKDV